MENTNFSKLFVGRLSEFSTEESLQSYFSQFGEVVTVEMARNRFTQQSQKFGFVTFKYNKIIPILMKKKHKIDNSDCIVTGCRAPVPRRPPRKKTSSSANASIASSLSNASIVNQRADLTAVSPTTTMSEQNIEAAGPAGVASTSASVVEEISPVSAVVSVSNLTAATSQKLAGTTLLPVTTVASAQLNPQAATMQRSIARMSQMQQMRQNALFGQRQETALKQQLKRVQQKQGATQAGGAKSGQPRMAQQVTIKQAAMATKLTKKQKQKHALNAASKARKDSGKSKAKAVSGSARAGLQVVAASPSLSGDQQQSVDVVKATNLPSTTHYAQSTKLTPQTHPTDSEGSPGTTATADTGAVVPVPRSHLPAAGIGGYHRWLSISGCPNAAPTTVPADRDRAAAGPDGGAPRHGGRASRQRRAGAANECPYQ